MKSVYITTFNDTSVLDDNVWYKSVFGVWAESEDENGMQDQIYAITMGLTDR